MKKIGIVTLNGNTNFGNRLQNYALKKTLNNLNFEVDTIWFLKSKKQLLKDKIKKTLVFKKKHARYCNFKKFSDRYLNIKYYTNQEIKNNYDYFVVGSDQVWNWSIYTDFNTYFLKFSPKEKNIAYAASFGVDNVPERYLNIFREGFNNIKDISVREDSGKKIVHEIGNCDSIVVLDPTMLLTSSDWESVSKKPKMLKSDKFILTYFLGEITLDKKLEIERISKENNCEIINILDEKSPYYTCGPSEFLYLEKNAFLICTDSFHSSVFAIIFNRPFIVFDRDDHNEKMNSRIDTLLSKFNLNNRKFSGNITNSLLQSDYTEAYEILKKEQEKSITFLKKSLNIGEVEKNERK